MENSVRSLLSRSEAAIMGIVNTTPDSFFDGGQFVDVDSAIRQAHKLVDEGADILDIGGESTRPGSDTVPLQQELDRVLPVIECLHAEIPVPISIDSCKPQVMQAAVSVGASMINDVNGLRAPGAIEAVVQSNVPVCIMHMLQQPKTMQIQPAYNDVVAEVIDFLNTQVKACIKQGISKHNVIVDPGIGFGKTLEHNLRLLQAVHNFRKVLECEVLIGVSRKSLVDSILNRRVDQRLYGSIGLAVQAVLNGAKIVRVHDVRATYDAVRSVEAVLNV